MGGSGALKGFSAQAEEAKKNVVYFCRSTHLV